MENVSRALIIAGEVLIAVLVLSLAGVLIVKFGKFSSDTNSKLAENELNEFNNRFYELSGRINITADEIASLLNFAKENNDSHEIDLTNTQNSQYYVNVKIKDTDEYSNGFFKYVYNKCGSNNISKTDFKNYINEFLKKYNNEFFYCNAGVKSVKNGKISVKIEDNKDIKISNLGRVNQIEFGLTNRLHNSLKDYIVANEDKYSIVYEQK